MRACIALALLGGLLWADDERALKEQAAGIAKRLALRDVEQKISAIREAAGVHHGSLVSPLVRLLRDKNERVRAEAIAALGMRLEPKDQKSAAKALAARLKPLTDKETEQAQEELLAVVQALHDLAQPTTVKALLDMKHGTDRGVALARARAVANVPSREAIERLITFGYKDRKGRGRTRDIAIKALAYATQRKMKGGIDAWRRWWSDNKDSFDIEAAAEARAKSRAAQKDRAGRKKSRKKKRKNDDGS